MVSLSDSGEASVCLPLSLTEMLPSSGQKESAFPLRHISEPNPFNLTAFGPLLRLPTLKHSCCQLCSKASYGWLARPCPVGFPPTNPNRRDLARSLPSPCPRCYNQRRFGRLNSHYSGYVCPCVYHNYPFRADFCDTHCGGRIFLPPVSTKGRQGRTLRSH